MNERGPIHHPIQVAIEDVYAAGHTPRLQIDARRTDVTVPDFIRRSWQARLVIDLDPSYPLDLQYGETGLEVDLAFQGSVSRCKFAWPAIYAVVDRTTGRAIVIEPHLPAATLSPELSWETKRPRLSAIPGSRDDLRAAAGRRPESRDELDERPLGEPPTADSRSPTVPSLAISRGAATGTPSTAPVAADQAGGSPSAPPGPSAGSSSSDEEAQKRRARFRVIEGGG